MTTLDVYGQNMPYPGADQPIGFWTSTIVAASFGLYLAFRKRDRL